MHISTWVKRNLGFGVHEGASRAWPDAGVCMHIAGVPPCASAGDPRLLAQLNTSVSTIRILLRPR